MPPPPAKNAKGKDGKDKKPAKEEEPFGYIPPELCDYCNKKNEPEPVDPSTIDDATKEKYLKLIDFLESRAIRSVTNIHL